MMMKKRLLPPHLPSSSSLLFSKWKFNLFYLFCFLMTFIFLFYGHFPMMGSKSFQPVLTIHPSSILSIQNSRSLSDLLFQLRVVDRIVFPDHVLLLLVAKNDGQSLLTSSAELECVYQVEQEQLSSTMVEVALSVLSVDEYNGLEFIVRCPSPPANYSALVNLRRHGSRGFDEGNLSLMADRSIHLWDKLVYGAVLDGETAVMFVKGLNLRADRESDASQFSCHFGWGNAERSTQYVLTTRAITAAQEVIRCSVPRSLRKLPAKAHGVQVTLGIPTYTNNRNRRRSNRLEDLGGASHHRLPSVAKLIDLKLKDTNSKKYDLCVCTMVWNQASSLREWIAYHSWLGVERWFIYNNNSEDNIKEVIDVLEKENYNVSRHVWPWIKTQEAGFSHCALRAKSECKWVGFIDVDEYYYFPVPATDRPLTNKLVYPGRNSLRSVVAKLSDSTTVGEIRTTCHSFGPSGLNSIPPRGVTVGYTCRLKSPERHKSIVRPDALDDTLLTVVHHFHLRPGYKSFNLPQSTAVINHYKYQVWESFRAKFSRRVATYVADWQENQNEGSKDRAPGLGTEAIEPPNWSRQFCEVWDTGLKDFIMASLADQDSGLLPWERSLP